jgi:hypothetical protein
VSTIEAAVIALATLIHFVSSRLAAAALDTLLHNTANLVH